MRFSDDVINTALNYGYKILAACISRTLVKYGLHCHLGVFHIGRTNNWNLSYDFIEPFRPLVDLWIHNNLPSFTDTKLNYNHRLGLIALLNEEVTLDGKVYSVSNAIELMVKSYVTVLKENNIAKLKLPNIIGITKDVKDEEQD